MRRRGRGGGGGGDGDGPVCGGYVGRRRVLLAFALNLKLP